MNFQLIVIVSIIGVISLSLCFYIFYNREDKKDFLKFGRRIARYSIPTLVISSIYVFFMFPNREKLNGISMSDQLKQNFRNSINNRYSTYIFGNSRNYRGIDPDLISNSAFNFSYDNETFFEQYFKIQYLNKNNIIPDTIILGVDYFEFSFVSEAMKDTYKEFFTEEYLTSLSKYYLNVNINSKKSESVDDYVNTTLSNIFGRSASQYFIYLYNSLFNNNIRVPYLKENGQYIIDPIPIAKEGDFVKRDTIKLNIQKKYFEKILTYSKQNNITIFLVMPPTRNIERKSYSETYVKEFDEYLISKCNKKNIYYISYFNIDFDLSLFMDDTHLTPYGALIYSNMLKEDLKYFQNNNKTHFIVK